MRDLIDRMLQENGRQRTWPAVETSPKRVRVKAGGTTVAEATSPLLYIDYGPPPLLPTYYFHRDQIRDNVLVNEQKRPDGSKVWAVETEDRRIERGAWTHPAPSGELTTLADLVTFTWWADLDWYEEAEQVFGHARDPYKRIDVVAGDRHVQVFHQGIQIADTRSPLVLFETMLPTRFYFSRDDVDMDRLTRSSTESFCPYKGWAHHWSLLEAENAGHDLAWSYHRTVPENPRVKDLICFYNEKVDLVLDGESQPRPITPWSV